MNIDMLTLYFTRYGAIAIFVIVLLEYMNMPGFPAGIIMPFPEFGRRREISISCM